MPKQPEQILGSNTLQYVKTLTSFKASQILMNLPQVKKVEFVVDRKALA